MLARCFVALQLEAHSNHSCVNLQGLTMSSILCTGEDAVLLSCACQTTEVLYASALSKTSQPQQCGVCKAGSRVPSSV
jgi:hypothetical protein